jgi:hypothetical protein
MKKEKRCAWCGGPLPRGSRGEKCYSCQELQLEALERQLKISTIPVNVKQAALMINKSEGHVRRILEHPEKYPWKNYGIVEDSYRAGKEWNVFLTPLEHEKERAKLLINIGESALNKLQIKKVFGFNPVITPKDMLSVLKCHVTPVPRKKTPRERKKQKEGIRQNLDGYTTSLISALSEIVCDWSAHEEDAAR